MHIYVAGSFNEKIRCCEIGSELRVAGHETYVFCDQEEETYRLSQHVREIGLDRELTAKTAMEHPLIQKIAALNIVKLAWCELVLTVLPSGRSAHLEAGYAKGQGKKVLVIGDATPGEWDVMYHLCDGVFEYSLSGFRELLERLKEME